MRHDCWARAESKCCLGVSACVDVLTALILCSFRQVQKHAVSRKTNSSPMQNMDNYIQENSPHSPYLKE